MDEPLKHIYRFPLPWRDEAHMTECGIDGRSFPTVTAEEAVADAKRLGAQRFAFAYCMTCSNTVERWWVADPAHRLALALQRDLTKTAYGRRRGQRDEPHPIINELQAIAALIEAHRDEFDDTIAALQSVTSLDEARAARNGRRVVHRL